MRSGKALRRRTPSTSRCAKASTTPADRLPGGTRPNRRPCATRSRASGRTTAGTARGSRRGLRAAPPPARRSRASIMGDVPPAEDAHALAVRVTDAMFARDRASQALGMRIVAVAPGAARLSMCVRADMLNGHAICHGGFIFTLADSTFAFACNSRDLATVASACTIDFLAPAHEGDVLTAATIERSIGGRMGVYDIEVTNQCGDTIALFRGKSYRVGGHVIDPGVRDA